MTKCRLDVHTTWTELSVKRVFTALKSSNNTTSNSEKLLSTTPYNLVSLALTEPTGGVVRVASCNFFIRPSLAICGCESERKGRRFSPFQYSAAYGRFIPVYHWAKIFKSTEEVNLYFSPAPSPHCRDAIEANGLTTTACVFMIPPPARTPGSSCSGGMSVVQ